MKSNIYWIPAPWAGGLAILARPRGNDWLNDEVQSWRDAGIEVVVSPLCPDEELQLELSNEAHLVQAESLRFINFPIEDYGVPASEAALHELVKKVEFGRSSLVAACLLVSSGQAVETSFEQIQKARGIPVPDTVKQIAWVADFALSSLNASR